MSITKSPSIINFNHITPDFIDIYKSIIDDDKERGCEFSFANLCSWGRQSYAIINNYIIFFSQYNRRTVYTYPQGKGDIRPAIDAIIDDSHARGIPCRITGLSDDDIKALNTLYPEKFRFHCDEGSFDYVYDINDLSELSGKKYHSKRNHIANFKKNFPNYSVEEISTDNIQDIKKMLEKWYADRLTENPNSDFYMERAAIKKVLENYQLLQMDGIILKNKDDLLAFTIGSRLSSNTVDVHYEKAILAANGAYATINCEFARYIREKYPEVKFLNREEDMGVEGLRKAKKSYHPHHMVKKCWACLLEDEYDY